MADEHRSVVGRRIDCRYWTMTRRFGIEVRFSGRLGVRRDPAAGTVMVRGPQTAVKHAVLLAQTTNRPLPASLRRLAPSRIASGSWMNVRQPDIVFSPDARPDVSRLHCSVHVRRFPPLRSDDGSIVGRLAESRRGQ